jgi:hypothetical protein
VLRGLKPNEDGSRVKPGMTIEGYGDN